MPSRRVVTYKTGRDVVSDRERSERLLARDKERRGVSADQLVFVGIHNLAQYWWCAQQSWPKSKENELEFFRAYLEDRLDYSLLLEGVERLPDDDDALLNLGSDIGRAVINQLLTAREARLRSSKLLKLGLPLSRSLPGTRLPKLDDRTLAAPPLERGRLMEFRHAERYARIRWNFAWKQYVLVGVPDGITDTFVYEYKTTRTHFLLNYQRPVAFSQADLYGHFFRRPKETRPNHDPRRQNHSHV